MMDNLWDAKRCAEFLGVSYDHFRKIRHSEEFPQPIPGPSRPRWNPDAWRQWMMNSCKNTHHGR